MRTKFYSLILMVLFTLSAATAAWADAVSLTEDADAGNYYVNMPYTVSASVTSTLTLTADDIATLIDAETGVASFKVYDNGGKSGEYGNNARSNLVINVPENYGLSLSGRIYTENVNTSGVPWDYLNIYDGTDNSAGILAKYLYNNGNWLDIGPYISTGNAMTLYFYSDGSGTYPGLDLTVTLVPTHSITNNVLAPNNGELTSVESAPEGLTVTMTATPSEGYVFVKAIVIDAESNLVPVTRNGNTISFTMPSSDVTVTPYFADPTVLSFDENGCLNNGTYFHLECADGTCTITQDLIDEPDEGTKDFMCWTDMQQYIEGDNNYQASAIVLGNNLNLGGYDADAEKCRMAFIPFGGGHSAFDGGNKTVEGFCYIASPENENAGFFENFSGTSFKNVKFTNAHVKGYVAGIAAANISASAISGISIENSTVLGVNLGGVAYSLDAVTSVTDVTITGLTMDTDGSGMPEGITIESTNIGGLAGTVNGTIGGNIVISGLTISNSSEIMTVSFGGLVGSCDFMSNTTIIKGVSIEGATISAFGTIGGIVGTSGDDILITQASFSGNITGSTVGGIIGSAWGSHNSIVIKNTYSVGTISGSSDQGYIIGLMSPYDPIGDNDYVFNNYHFGDDNVELGIGGDIFDAESWTIGTLHVFGNVRNKTTSLGLTGAMGLYQYKEGVDGPYMEFFPFDYRYVSNPECEGEPECPDLRSFFSGIKNGAADPDDMKSDMFAALLNRNPIEDDNQYIEYNEEDHFVWTRSDDTNEGLPVFVHGNLQPNRVVFVSWNSAMSSLTPEQKTSFGFYDWYGEFNDGDGWFQSAIVGYTDSTGYLGSVYQSNISSMMDAVSEIYDDEDVMLVDKQGNFISPSVAISSEQEWRVLVPETYTVAYNYCSTEYDNSCALMENVTGKTFIFMSSPISSFTNDATEFMLIPNVVDLQGTDEDPSHTRLVYTIKLYDENDGEISTSAFGDMTGNIIWTFADVARVIRANGYQVKTVSLNYRVAESEYYFPKLTMIPSSASSFSYDIYGEDDDGEEVRFLYSSASGWEPEIIPFGEKIRAYDFSDKMGYTKQNTYAAIYKYDAYDENRCAEEPEPQNFVVTEKSFAGVDALLEAMGQCATATWKINSLSETDKVVLSNVRTARTVARERNGVDINDTLFIFPDYTLNTYHVTFDLNRPEEVTSNSGIFLGTGWNGASTRDMDVEHPEMPRIHAIGCPTILGWTWTADPSTIFGQERYKYTNTFENGYLIETADPENNITTYAYWKTEDCEEIPTIAISYVAKEGGNNITDPTKFYGSIVLKQKFDDGLTIEHPIDSVYNQLDELDEIKTTLPLVDDTLSFVVTASAQKGYTVGNIEFHATTKANHGIEATNADVVLGYDAPAAAEDGDTTLVVNPMMLDALAFRVTFNYADFEVNFVRPVGESALNVNDKPVDIYVADASWTDSKTYTLESTDKTMPKLYANGGCVAWSYVNEFNVNDPVFTEFDDDAVQGFVSPTTLYPVYFTGMDDPERCADAPVETFTISAHVPLANHLNRLELWQFIGNQGENNHIDTIKHVLVQDENDATLFTLNVPKVRQTDVVEESYVPFTFKIYAVPEDGWATFAHSYYRKVMEADEEVNDYITTLATEGYDDEFYVDLIGGVPYTLVFHLEQDTIWHAYDNGWGRIDQDRFKHFFYIGDTDREDLPASYELGENVQKLPMLYAASFADGSANNKSGTYLLAGWTVYADSAHCPLSRTKKAVYVDGSFDHYSYCLSNGKNLFTTYSGDMVAAIQASVASHDITLDENNTVHLYPVWGSQNQNVNTISVACPGDDPRCVAGAQPMVVTLTQAFNAGGQEITLTNASVDDTRFYNTIAFPGTGPYFTMDVSFVSNPGFEISSIALDESVQTGTTGRTFNNGKLNAKGAAYLYTRFIPDDYSLNSYTLNFDISSLENKIAAFGQNWFEYNGSKTMDLGANRGFPNLYVLNGDEYYGAFNEVFWTKEEAPEDEEEQYYWYWSYVGSSMKQQFTSDLITRYFGENPSETETTVYPLIVSEIGDNNAARGSWTIWFRSDDDHDVNSYHGSVVISQTWNGMTFEQKSVLSGVDGVTLHALHVPNADDTLVYNVSLAPDPGYTMSLQQDEGGAFGWTDDDGYGASVPQGEGWGFNLDDPDAMTLKVQPDRMYRWYNEANVSFTALHYNVRYTMPADAPVFVANKLVNDEYLMDWQEIQSDVTVENIEIPLLYNVTADNKTCSVSWKVKKDEAHEYKDFRNEFYYMTPTETTEYFVNDLLPAIDNPVCEERAALAQTLTIEGEGTIRLEQVLDVTPENEGDPTQVVLKHSFVEDESTGDKVLMVPSIRQYDEENDVINQVGAKFRVVAEPGEDYALKEITYNFTHNGNLVTALVQDSDLVNVLQDLQWHVKFVQYKPVQVAYDLSLGANDSSKIWIPADGAPEAELVLGAEGSAPMWTPFRTDSCFVGWSKKPASERGDDDLTYRELNTENYIEFSADGLNRLYAVWVPYTGSCSWPSNSQFAVISKLRYYEDEENYSDMFNDTLEVSQKFGDAVFTHRAWFGSDYGGEFTAGPYSSNPFKFVLNPSGYVMSFKVLPGVGKTLDEDSPEAKLFAYTEDGIAAIEGEDGWFLVQANADMNEYHVGFKEIVDTYEIALSPNAGGANVLFGENWSGTWYAKVGEAMPMASVFRKDACFAGWSFDPEESANSALLDENNVPLLQQREERISAGLNADTLYAIWDASESGCRTQFLSLSVNSDVSDKVVVSFYQNVDGEETKVLEIGNEPVMIPFDVKRSVNSVTNYIGDNIYFSRVEVTPNPGMSVAENYTVSYVNQSDDEMTVHSLPTVAGAEFLFDDNAVISVTGVGEISYNVAYNEDAGDASVFYGENWAATGELLVGESLNKSLYRADKCLAGWKVSDAGSVYESVDADFIAEYDAALAASGETSVPLYAVWSSDANVCELPENIAVTISDNLKDKATIELVQTVGGEAKVVATVGAEGISIPKVEANEHVLFSALNIVPVEGYAITEGVNPSYKIGEAEAVEVTAATEPWYMTDATVLSSAVTANGYVVAFDENAGTANVFYPSTWVESATYNLDDEADARVFPKLYRTDKCLVGYGFSKDASKLQSFDTFDASFVAAYDSVVASGVESPLVIYGVWNECSPAQTIYTVTLNDFAEGTLKLTNNGNVYSVPSNGFKVPAATPGLEFELSFVLNPGYVMDAEGVYNVVDDDELSEIENAKLVVDGNKVVDAPVITLENTFAFDVNAGNATLFYGDDWKESGSFKLDDANTAFPMGVYRVGNCLKGWTINEEIATPYTQFDTDFLASVETASNAGLPVNKLYAVWGECDATQTLATVANANAAAGTFTLTRVVSNTTMTYDVAGETLTVPADDPLAFTVSYAANTGYAYSDEITAADAAGEPVEINDGVLTVAGDLTLSAAVAASAYNFALDVNAGDANVFYAGEPVTEISMQINDAASAREFPKNVYRSDACLVGYAFAANVAKSYEQLDETFIAAYDSVTAANGEVPTTLYAVWNEACYQVLYTVSNDEKAKGTLTLAQGERSFEVGTSGLTVPAVTGGLEFNVEFTPAAGYVYDAAQGLSAYNSLGQNIDVLANGVLTVNQTTVLKAVSLTATTYAITFATNADDAIVFYGNAWRAGTEQTSFSLTNVGNFPADIYRTDACFAGWTLVEDNADAAAFFAFDAAFVAAAGEDFSGTLYAKWGECTTANRATVSQVTAYAGKLVLTQTNAAGDVLNTTEIEDVAVTLPLGSDDISFNVSFVVGEGYVLDPEGYFYTVSSNGNNISALVDGKLAFSGNTSLRAPIVSDTYAVAFDVNAGNATLFYGDDWVENGVYNVGDEAIPFPTGVYRVGSCLTGWALNADAETVYTQFDIPFMREVETAKKSGLPVGVLYAVWGDCTTEQALAVVSNSNAAAGTFTLSRTVAGVTKKYSVANEALTVPADEVLSFNVTFAPNAGYIYDDAAGISAEDASGEVMVLSDAVLSVSGNFTLAASVSAAAYEFALDMNAGDANVFYAGEPVTSVSMVMTGDAAARTFPTNAYRSDACLVGYAFSANATTGFELLDDAFVAAYESVVAESGEAPETLYAVWDTDCRQTLYTVTSSDVGKGTLTLAQGERLFEVGASGLKVPAVSGGLEFTAEFTPAAGYNYDAEQGLSAYNGLGSEIGALEDGVLVVSQTTVVKAVSLTAVAFEIAFVENAGEATVFYGNAWRAGTEQTSFSLSNAGAFPTDLYRTDACFAGWTLVADNADATAFFTFDAAFVAAAGENFAGSLYAKWGECTTANRATVSQVTAYAGKLVLTQTNATGDVLNTTEVEDVAVTLPLGNDDISFNISFVVGEGYVLDPEGYFYTVSSNGNNISALVDGKLAFSGNTSLRAPIVSDTYAVAFNVNAGNATLFYGDEWVENKVFVVGDEAIPFPTGVYRVGSCLTGWALNADAETSYTQFDIPFMREVETAKKAGLPVGILYAVWGDCETEQVLATVTHTNGATGSFTLSREVSETLVTYELASDGLVVPVPEEGALTFSVAFTAASGYEYDSEMTVTDADGTTSPMTNGEITVSADMSIEAAVTATVYEFAIDMNAGSADLFYVGQPVTNVVMHVTDNAAAKTLPTNVYRRDACLDGFAFTDNATGGYKQLDAAFVSAYESFSGERPETLYAVWDTDCRQKLATVTSADAGKGTLALYHAGKRYEVGSAGLTVPMVEGGLEFVAEFTEDVGYNYDALRGVEVYNASNESIGTSDEDGVITVAQNVSVKAVALTANIYEISYLENSGDAPVYYGNAWRAGNYQTQFSRTNTGALPMDLYRTDSCLAGWTLSLEPDAEIFTEFDRDMLVAGDGSVGVLYAKWGACLNDNNAIVSQVTSDAGTLVLTQTDADGGWLAEVYIDADAVTLPLGKGDVSFDVSFMETGDYVVDPNGYYYTVDAAGNNVAALVENKLNLAGNTKLRAPVVSGTYEVVFNVNAGNATLFYGEDWVESAEYYLSDDPQAFPKGVYRVGACLQGWALNANSTTAYTEFGIPFMTVVESAKKSGLPVNTLYAVWGECETEQALATVTNSNATVGGFTLTRVVSNTTMTYTVAGESLVVPADEVLTFDIEFTPNSGYEYDWSEGLSYTDASGTTSPVIADELPVAGNVSLAAAVDAIPYNFEIDENAGGAAVFYAGALVTEVELRITDTEAARTLPTNLYRGDACLAGYAFKSGATAGFTQFDSAFIAAYDAASLEDEAPTTLYAVWNTACSQTLYTVTSADAGKGKLTLYQADGRSFEVGSGLKVPAAADGIEFVAEFEPATGYEYDADAGLEAFTAIGQPIGALAEGALTVNQSVIVSAASLVAAKFEVVFAENAGDAKVFYGDAWRSGRMQTEFSLSNAGVFPTDLYRTDSCLYGWTLNRDEDATVFTEFDGNFVAAANEGFNGELYAKWGRCLNDNNATVSQVSSAAGTLVLAQTDADGEELNRIEIGADAVTLPLGNGDVSFVASFDAGEGYSLVEGGYFYTVDALGNNVSALVGNKITLAGNTVLRAPILSDTYVIAFNTNAGNANVFYGSGWVSEGQFSMGMDETARTYPTEIYRVGYSLVGWSLEPMEDGATLAMAEGETHYRGVYGLYDEEFAAIAKEYEGSTIPLYAVWAQANNQQTYRITLADADAGYITATQAAGKAEVSFTVAENGLEVPAVTGGLAFNVKATLNEGYFADGYDLYLVNADGVRTETIDRGALVVDGDKKIEIPVRSDGVQFVFSENTDARVFYENGWKNKGLFSLSGNTEFPNGILRTDAMLLGWKISRSSSKYYTVYNSEFINDLQNYVNVGMPTDTLYAVWVDVGSFENVNLTNASDKNGAFYISQTVNGVETDPILVTADGVKIPYSEKGITFNVTFEAKPGYYLNAEEAISGVDTRGSIVGSSANGGTLVLSSLLDVALNASVGANSFKFSYDINGGDANVFFGDSWSSTGVKALDDESVAFPTNIYRADACLEGWSTDPEAESGSAVLTSEFIETLDRTQNVNTLYAVWKECDVETYTVSFANTNVGSLVLTQDVEDAQVSFEVAEEGLLVPVVEGGLKFKAAYTLKPGFSGNTDSLYIVDDLSGLMNALADNSLTVDNDMTLAIPTEGETFKIVFDVNRKGNLFYGTDWVESSTYMLSDKKTVIPLPAYVYTSDACMVGWSLDSDGGDTYLKFTTELAAVLQESNAKDGAYKMYAIWGEGKACDNAYDRISLTSVNGTVRLAEAPRGDKTEFIEHEFMKDGTMILPKTMNGNNIRIIAYADSSYMLDSLVMTREGSDEERQVFIEGDALGYNLAGTKFEAFFGKSNRTVVAFADSVLAQSGNAIRFSFTTTEFEVTRKVAAHVRLETEDGELVEDTTFIDSIEPPYSGSWEKFPLAAGKYVLTATVGDERESDTFTTSFEVKAEIAAVSEEGWQMISIGNLDKDAMVWDGDAKFYWWDEAGASGDYWQYKEFDPKDEIIATRGYWYSSLEGRPLVLKPESDIEVTKKVEWKLDSINSGWNLVANPYGFALNLYGDHPAEKVDETEKSNVTFWNWNPDIADYEQVDVVNPYGAVWVKVQSSTDWTIPVAPDFDSAEADEDTLEVAGAVEKALKKSRSLVKANGKNDWRIQAVLSDARGHMDAWNLLGASNTPFVTDEPPAGMGDHVNLSIVEGNRRFAKSVKAPADEQEWVISLAASSERYGELSFNGVDELNAFGLKVFVTVDGKTTEMHDGKALRVALKSSASAATVRVAKSAKVVADLHIDGLRSVQSGRSLNVSFVASADLAGTRTVVEVLNMDGRVLSSRSATTLAGTNALALDAPRGGMYMLRVRAGSQMKAGRIIVR